MNFGLTFEKLMLIGLIAVLLIGPERLPRYAEGFARIVRRGGEMLRDTKGRVREEMGPELSDVDWRKLDPRQYDPRRIIRDALFEEPGATSTAVATASAAASAPAAEATDQPPAAPAQAGPAIFSRTSPPPYDVEAT